MVKTRKIKKILVNGPEIVDRIASQAGCRKVTVYNALAYRSNSKMAQDIRDMALKRFGGVSANQTIVVGS